MLSVGKSRVVIPLRRLFQQTALLIATPSTPPASLSQPVSYDTPYLRVSRRCYHEASSSLHATSPDRPVCPPNHAHCLGGPRTLDKFHSCRAGWHTRTMHRWWAPAVLQEHSMVRVALGIISITSATITTWGSVPIQLVLKDRGKTSFKHICIKIAVHLLISLRRTFSVANSSSRLWASTNASALTEFPTTIQYPHINTHKCTSSEPYS